jgi:hypothetical protein
MDSKAAVKGCSRFPNRTIQGKHVRAICLLFKVYEAGGRPMSCGFEFHPETTAILPIVAVATAGCECCGEEHWALQIGWLWWSLVLSNANEH